MAKGNLTRRVERLEDGFAQPALDVFKVRLISSATGEVVYPCSVAKLEAGPKRPRAEQADKGDEGNR